MVLQVIANQLKIVQEIYEGLTTLQNPVTREIPIFIKPRKIVCMKIIETTKKNFQLELYHKILSYHKEQVAFTKRQIEL